MSDLMSAYRERFHCWVPNSPDTDPDDHEHDWTISCDYGWQCNTDGCTERVDDEPCPQHAPLAFPGLRLVECVAEPRHWLYSHDRDDYGHFCPACTYDMTHAELEPLKLAAERRRHRWCWLFNPVKRAAIWVGVARWRGSTGNHACWHVDARWRWSR